MGTAYITGFRWAIEKGYDYIFEMDADFSHDPHDLPRLYRACADEGYDVAVGSRYVTGVNVVNWPMGRVLMSYYASKYVQFVTGLDVHDTTAGQTVDIDFNLGQVYVDGELLDEDYINDYTYREEGTVFPLTVPEGEVFLMGDNRNHSNDSRDSSLGTVDTRLLIGKAVFLVFPGRDYLTEQREFGRIGLLP